MVFWGLRGQGEPILLSPRKWRALGYLTRGVHVPLALLVFLPCLLDQRISGESVNAMIARDNAMGDGQKGSIFVNAVNSLSEVCIFPDDAGYIGNAGEVATEVDNPIARSSALIVDRCQILTVRGPGLRPKRCLKSYASSDQLIRWP